MVWASLTQLRAYILHDNTIKYFLLQANFFLQYLFGNSFCLCELERLHLDFKADTLHLNSSGHDAQIHMVEYVIIIYQGETSPSTFPLHSCH